MVYVDLDTLEGLSNAFVDELNELKELFVRTDRFGDLMDNPRIMDLSQRIHDFIYANGIVAYHFTRANPEDIRANGVLMRTGPEIQQTFIRQYGKLFTKTQLDQMSVMWGKLNRKQGNVRDCRFFFNLTTTALYNGGSENLLKYYGGEQVYMWIRGIPGVAETISQLGKPLILKVKVPSGIIENNALDDDFFGRIAISSFLPSVNEIFLKGDLYDIDGFITEPIPPQNIDILELGDDFETVVRKW